jgi:hypothetical protein
MEMLEDLQAKNQVEPLWVHESHEVALEIPCPAYDWNAVAINRRPGPYPVDSLKKSRVSCAHVEGCHRIRCILLRELSGDLIVSIVFTLVPVIIE